ncbi:CoA transferase subunit A [Microbacterium sp.]|uniref:CoA transferase subunit A n=1 Tax=Microbacterium sp. TaxID=51671 RepID=UPI0037CB5A48
MSSKVMTEDEAVALIRDGDVLGLQAGPTQCAPMSIVRGILRSGVRDLTLVSLSGSLALDWFAASDAVSRVLFATATMESFGTCRHFRRGVESGAIAAEEYSETALFARLSAGARRLPFLPTRGMLGSDLLEVGNENLAVIPDPFGGPPVVACRALRPDVAILHADRADVHGNIAMDPGPRSPMTTLLPRAADRVIVSVEEIVDTEVLRAAPEQTVIPAFAVDAVVVAPFGAHPTSFFPSYDYDDRFFDAWTAVSGSREDSHAFLDAYVHRPTTHESYLDLVGRSRLDELRAMVRR